MDFSQEQKFVARWRPILIPWWAKTEAEAVRGMHASCIGVLIAVVVFVASNEFDSAWKVGAAVFAVIIGVIAAWLALRLRVIARIFDLAGPQSFSELPDAILEQHRSLIRSHDRA